MTPSHPGRNDPCPCGSGSTYGQCCFPNGPAESPGSDVFAELRRQIAGRNFDSMEDLQAFADSFMARRNRATLDDFHGLSPEQMTGFLYQPFDSSQWISFSDHVAAAMDAPITFLFSRLADAIGERGLKCTAKGNLPRAFCREAGQALEERSHTREIPFGINTEEDFSELHVTRIVAAAAGLIRKHRGRLILSRECRQLLGGDGMGAIYPRLLRAQVQRYNWGYADGYPDLPFIQTSFLFTLYLLQRYGAEDRPSTFYEDAYLRAFPALLDEVVPRLYSSAETQIRNCYTLRTLVRFAGVAGLASVQRSTMDILGRKYSVRKKALLDEAVCFRL